jgi:hypothetical protein
MIAAAKMNVNLKKKILNKVRQIKMRYGGKNKLLIKIYKKRNCHV